MKLSPASLAKKKKKHTLFEVAMSLCSSLDDVIRGTLQRGSYVSLFWKKDFFFTEKTKSNTSTYCTEQSKERNAILFRVKNSDIWHSY